MDKVLVKIYVPALESSYDVWIPANKKIYNVIYLLMKAVNDLNDNCYKPKEMPLLYDKITGECFDINKIVKDTTIRSGTEVVLI